MVRLLDWLGLVEGVYLRDAWGVVYKSFVKPNIFKDKNPCAWTYPFYKIGNVVLLPDGIIEQPHYIKQWRWMKEVHNVAE